MINNKKKQEIVGKKKAKIITIMNSQISERSQKDQVYYLTIGAIGVGKTSFLQRLCTNSTLNIKATSECKIIQGDEYKYIDTPGIDDKIILKNKVILSIIKFLFEKNIKLSNIFIIYIQNQHNISHLEYLEDLSFAFFLYDLFKGALQSNELKNFSEDYRYSLRFLNWKEFGIHQKNDSYSQKRALIFANRNKANDFLQYVHSSYIIVKTKFDLIPHQDFNQISPQSIKYLRQQVWSNKKEFPFYLQSLLQNQGALLRQKIDKIMTNQQQNEFGKSSQYTIENILLLGKSQIGKSLLIEQIEPYIGAKGYCKQTQTKYCSFYSIFREQVQYRFIDTPGYNGNVENGQEDQIYICSLKIISDFLIRNNIRKFKILLMSQENEQIDQIMIKKLFIILVKMFKQTDQLLEVDLINEIMKNSIQQNQYEFNQMKNKIIVLKNNQNKCFYQLQIVKDNNNIELELKPNQGLIATSLDKLFNTIEQLEYFCIEDNTQWKRLQLKNVKIIENQEQYNKVCETLFKKYTYLLDLQISLKKQNVKSKVIQTLLSSIYLLRGETQYSNDFLSQLQAKKLKQNNKIEECLNLSISQHFNKILCKPSFLDNTQIVGQEEQINWKIIDLCFFKLNLLIKDSQIYTYLKSELNFEEYNDLNLDFYINEDQFYENYSKMSEIQDTKEKTKLFPNELLDEVKVNNFYQSKIYLIIGNIGVGKSSFIKKLIKNNNTPIEIGGGKDSITQTCSMYEINGQKFIDTPSFDHIQRTQVFILLQIVKYLFDNNIKLGDIFIISIKNDRLRTTMNQLQKISFTYFLYELYQGDIKCDELNELLQNFYYSFYLLKWNEQGFHLLNDNLTQKRAQIIANKNRALNYVQHFCTNYIEVLTEFDEKNSIYFKIFDYLSESFLSEQIWSNKYQHEDHQAYSDYILDQEKHLFNKIEKIIETQIINQIQQKDKRIENILLLGKSQVGKSSLIEQLTSFKGLRGTGKSSMTNDCQVYPVLYNNIVYRFIDTPGHNGREQNQSPLCNLKQIADYLERNKIRKFKIIFMKRNLFEDKQLTRVVKELYMTLRSRFDLYKSNLDSGQNEQIDNKILILERNENESEPLIPYYTNNILSIKFTNDHYYGYKQDQLFVIDKDLDNQQKNIMFSALQRIKPTVIEDNITHCLYQLFENQNNLQNSISQQLTKIQYESILFENSANTKNILISRKQYHFNVYYHLLIEFIKNKECNLLLLEQITESILIQEMVVTQCYYKQDLRANDQTLNFEVLEWKDRSSHQTGNLFGIKYEIEKAYFKKQQKKSQEISDQSIRGIQTMEKKGRSLLGFLFNTTTTTTQIFDFTISMFLKDIMDGDLPNQQLTYFEKSKFLNKKFKITKYEKLNTEGYEALSKLQTNNFDKAEQNAILRALFNKNDNKQLKDTISHYVVENIISKKFELSEINTTLNLLHKLKRIQKQVQEHKSVLKAFYNYLQNKLKENLVNSNQQVSDIIQKKIDSYNEDSYFEIEEKQIIKKYQSELSLFQNLIRMKKVSYREQKEYSNREDNFNILFHCYCNLVQEKTNYLFLSQTKHIQELKRNNNKKCFELSNPLFAVETYFSQSNLLKFDTNLIENCEEYSRHRYLHKQQGENQPCFTYLSSEEILDYNVAYTIDLHHQAYTTIDQKQFIKKMKSIFSEKNIILSESLYVGMISFYQSYKYLSQYFK